MDGATHAALASTTRGVWARGLGWGAGWGAALGALYFPAAAVISAAFYGVPSEVGLIVLGSLPATAVGALLGLVAAAAGLSLVALTPPRWRWGWGASVAAAVVAAVVGAVTIGVVAYVSDRDFPVGFVAIIAAIAVLPALWGLRRLTRGHTDPDD